MVMALLIGQPAFDYWHTGQGSLVFSMIAVLLFGVFCWFAFLRDTPTAPGASSHG
jgi:hypothetical protein